MTLAAQFDAHTFVDAFRFMWDDRSLLLTKTLEHLELSLIAIGISMLLALPLGVWLGHIHRGSFLAINVSNLGRALPSLAVISIGLGIFGIGYTDGVVALVILAWPLMLTNAFIAGQLDVISSIEPYATRAKTTTTGNVLGDGVDL